VARDGTFLVAFWVNPAANRNQYVVDYLESMQQRGWPGKVGAGAAQR
jgi:hypothetical protein